MNETSHRPDVIVVVVTYHSASVVTALLDSIPAGVAPYDYKVLVVDNGSTDDTREILEARDDVVLLYSANVGYAAAINRAIRHAAADSPAFLVLNPDTVVHPGALAEMMPVLQEPGVGIVAPRTLDPSGMLMFTQRREPTLLRALGLGRTNLPALSEHVGDARAYSSRQAVDWAVGSALLVSRRCHEALGGWDPSFFLYSEETDFCLRARDLGFRTVYVPCAVVTHAAGASGRSPRTHSMQVLNRVRLYRRRHSLVPSAAYFAAILAGEMARSLRTGNAGARRAVRDLLRPRSRPPEIGASARLLPR